MPGSPATAHGAPGAQAKSCRPGHPPPSPTGPRAVTWRGPGRLRSRAAAGWRAPPPPPTDNPPMRFSPRAIGLLAAVVTVTIWTGFIVIARASAQRTLTPFDIALLRIV